ncbi:MAG: hypothetical protein ACMXYC_02660 [Candidatus Woesearchaeota archaeon]
MSIPIQHITMLRNQGLSTNQIVQQLQQQGHSSHDIFEALNMADMHQQQPQSPAPFTPPQNPMQMNPQGIAPSQQDDNVEELIEQVIEEKWREIKQNMDKLSTWKDKVDQKMAKLEQSIAHLEHDFSQVHQAILGKIGDYDKTMTNVGSQLNAMEMVFSKSLPLFTENVQELSRISEKLKR